MPYFIFISLFNTFLHTTIIKMYSLKCTYFVICSISTTRNIIEKENVLNREHIIITCGYVSNEKMIETFLTYLQTL